ncbi:hypothetical protein Q0812_10235 [Brevundimonas sp. 2R-24]|uniref:Uncharacterized protein n=1 Tax=Peiella sedimenti TaxID=3061083 RepID=A0ABT8SPN0_9CAUL|nr:hypothetical protein [Caulobacteraceae bacterium XZ-24]
MTLNERAKDIGGGLLAIFVGNLLLIAAALLIEIPASGFVEASLWVMAIFGSAVAALAWGLGALAIRAGLKR